MHELDLGEVPLLVLVGAAVTVTQTDALRSVGDEIAFVLVDDWMSKATASSEHHLPIVSLNQERVTPSLI